MRSVVRRAKAWIAAATVAGCSSGSAAPPAETSPSLTYYKDVAPILDAKCNQCHAAGGIAPFTLTTPEDAIAHQIDIASATAARVMPPWPPAKGCNEYKGDRSLTDEHIATIGGWVDGGAKLGDPSEYKPLGSPAAGLSRVDRTLTAPAPYTPKIRPDEYRCFLLDWPETTTKYITGFGVTPGQPSILHHVLAYVASPDQVAIFQAYDDADPEPGYACFGGPSGPSGDASTSGPPAQLGAWAPGSMGADFPPNTGINVAAGSKIIVQFHYNTLTAEPVADQTALKLELADTVEREAVIIPFTNPSWVFQKTMSIPAGTADMSYSFSYDAVRAASVRGQGIIATGLPLSVYSAALHMHLHGTHTTLSVVHLDGTSACLLDIPNWDFHWQGGYGLTGPMGVVPGDAFRIECHWDNSATNQPVIDGQLQAPLDLNWGERTTDEMCIGFMYVTQ